MADQKEYTQEQYDAYVEQIRQGKAVLLKGRRAYTIEQLHFALDADDSHAPEYLAPAIPMILGLPDELQTQGLVEQVQQWTELAEKLQRQHNELDAIRVRLGTDKALLEKELETANAALAEANTELARRKELLDSLQAANDGLVAQLKALKGQQVPSPDAVTQTAPADTTPVPVAAPSAEANVSPATVPDVVPAPPADAAPAAALEKGGKGAKAEAAQN